MPLSPAEELTIKLKVPSEWSGIEPVREAVSRLLHVVFVDRDLADAVSMVCAELLDNAVRYGRHDQQGIGFSIQILESQLVVSVSHGIAYGSPDVPRLLDRMAWVMRMADPERAYVEAIGEVGARAAASSGGPGVAAGMGVGLARIAYIGGCRLSCDASTRDRITVIAMRMLPVGETSPRGQSDAAA